MYYLNKYETGCIILCLQSFKSNSKVCKILVVTAFLKINE